MGGVSFSYPWVLWLELLLLPMGWFLFRTLHSRFAPIKYSSLSQFEGRKKNWRERLWFIPDVLLLIAIAVLILALARPQYSLSRDDKNIEGIDIVMALDVSPSMLAEDFKPNRLEAAKKVAKDFIDNRKNDQMGLIVFSGEAFTQCPPTIDHDVLLELLAQTRSGDIADGTAIGDGLAVAINRIKESKAKSRVIILITDGVNNTGQVDPATAASFAKEYGIRIYTIGIGTRGMAPYPYPTPLGVRYQQVPVEIDEALLKSVASQTGGRYFRSTKNSSLESIFKEIDSLEKSIIEVSLYQQKEDVGWMWTRWALALLVIACVLRGFVFRNKY